MAPMASSSHYGAEENVPIEEIVFSCSICQATVSDVYLSSESNKGFYSGSGDGDGIVTKMWIAECSHVTCAKHLDGGAVPFHPKDTEPRAPCPRCIQSSGDDIPKALYGIRGLSEGEIDPAIPVEWRRCPAISLDNSVPGMEAVRFQYMALCHYGRRARKHCQDASNKQRALETAYSKERKERRQLQTELLALENQVGLLKEAEAELHKWQDKKPEILHCLGAFGEMSSEIEGCRAVLRNLGYSVQAKSYAFRKDDGVSAPAFHNTRHPQAQAAESRSYSADQIADATYARYADETSSTRKRKREGYRQSNSPSMSRHAPRPDNSSRELMPPPLQGRNDPVGGREHQFHPSAVTAKAWPSQIGPQARQDSALWPTHTPPDSSQLRQRSMAAHLPAPVGIWEPANRAEHNRLELALPSSSQGQVRRLYKPQIATQNANKGHFQSYDDAIEPYRHTASAVSTQCRQHEGIASSQAFEPQHRPGRSTTAQRSNFPATSQESRHWAQIPFANHNLFDDGAVQLGARSPYKRIDERPAHALPAVSGFVSARQGPYARGASQYPTMSYLSSSDRATRPSPQRQAYKSANHQQSGVVPHTPRNLQGRDSQGLFQRSDRALPSATSRNLGNPDLNTTRSRVSFPPKAGRPIVSGQQDVALSRIVGVRGLSSRQAQPTSDRAAPAYPVSRQLFSSASNRRSVRR